MCIQLIVLNHTSLGGVHMKTTAKMFMAIYALLCYTLVLTVFGSEQSLSLSDEKLAVLTSLVTHATSIPDNLCIAVLKEYVRLVESGQTSAAGISSIQYKYIL